jgi:hypothetical protein
MWVQQVRSGGSACSPATSVGLDTFRRHHTFVSCSAFRVKSVKLLAGKAASSPSVPPARVGVCVFVVALGAHDAALASSLRERWPGLGRLGVT